MTDSVLLKWIRLLGDATPADILWLVGDADRARSLTSSLSRRGLIQRHWRNSKIKVWR